VHPEDEDSGEEVGSDDPFIHSPNIIDDDVRNGLMCFMDGNRPCGPECMAYLGFGQEVQTQHLSVQQSQCLLLVGVERLSRHSAIIAKLISDGLHAAKIAEADRKRSEQRPPPGPLGQPAGNQRTGGS